MCVKQILIISDGKPGHRNQSLGLAEAIARRTSVEISEREPMGRFEALRLCLGGALPQLDDRPDLLIGAGHTTHLTLLALRKLYRAPAIVLMKPSIPMGFFDLCLVPEHDQPPRRPNIIVTDGALNRMLPGEKAPGSGVILIGGPSKHYRWDEAGVLNQVQALLESEQRDWLIGSSRRTPASTEQALSALCGDRFVPAAETGPDWLPQQLASAEVCWITEDSASMVYEALTAGCQVGVLPLRGNADNRIGKGIEQLATQGLVVRAPDWSMSGLAAAGVVFNEAERCAEEVLRREWL
ncbi:mitochondrial fission protein ELM1 [Marinobacterium sp. MBR-109]